MCPILGVVVPILGEILARGDDDVRDDLQILTNVLQYTAVLVALLRQPCLRLQNNLSALSLECAIHFLTYLPLYLHQSSKSKFVLLCVYLA